MPSKTLAYVNDRFVPDDECRMSPTDAAYSWGAIVTDRLRTFGGQFFRLDDHLRRFRRSCELARIPQPISDDRLREASLHLAKANYELDELSLVWLATPGPLARLVRFAPGPPPCPTLMAYTAPLFAADYSPLFEEGVFLQTVKVSSGIDPRIKHRSRLSWWIATQEAHDLNAEAEALFIESSTGQVLETPTANLIAVLDGTLVSPPVGTVLDGVSLNVVRELCQTNAIPFAERPLMVADLYRASEVLLTNTSFCLAGVSRIDGRPIPFPGPILNQLVDAWSELVGVPIRL